ncbi:MAG: PQQ-binding-like beta-propeller repeat protein [Planctomycetota bacterium]
MLLRGCLIALLLGTALAALPAAESAQLHILLPDGAKMTLLTAGDAPRVSGGWVQRDADDGNPLPLLVSGLTMKGTAIAGEVVENIPGKRRRAARRWTLQLTFSGTKVAGTCAEADGRSGAVSGQMIGMERLRQAEGIDPRCNWPAWRGNGCGVATHDKGQALIENPKQARFVWLSQPLPLPGHTPDHGTVGGYGSFCAWEGKLFLLYYEGSGGPPWKGARSVDAHWSELNEKQQGNQLAQFGTREAWAKAKLSVLADDVLVCIDAASGITLWERRFAQKGFNWADISGAHFHPCTDGERVYAVGSSGRIYAVDAVTGEPVWETVVPGMDPDAGRDQALAQAAAGHDLSGKERPLEKYSPFRHCGIVTSKPRIIGGVLVLAEHGLVGFDPKTGRKLWGPLGEVETGNAFTWTHQGKELILCSMHYKRHPGPGVICVEPQSGRVLWQNKHILPELAQMLIQDDLMFVSGAMNNNILAKLKDSPNAGLHLEPSCYRLSSSGAERIWRLEPGQTEHATSICAIAGVIYRDHIYHKLLSGKEATGRRQGPVSCIALADGGVKGSIARGMQAGGSWNETIAGDGRLLHLGFSPVFLYAKADPEDYRVLHYNQDGDDRWCFPGGIPYLVTPILIDGRLIYRGFNHLYCFDLRVGKR